MRPRWQVYLAAGHLNYTFPTNTTITRWGAFRIARRLNRSRYASTFGLVFGVRRWRG